MQEQKRMSIKEFQEFGYLQELNRQFLHPLGLALECIVNNETGEVSLGGIWDNRDSQDGMAFADWLIDKEKVNRVAKALDEKSPSRIKIFGSIIQPVLR